MKPTPIWRTTTYSANPVCAVSLSSQLTQLSENAYSVNLEIYQEIWELCKKKVILGYQWMNQFPVAAVDNHIALFNDTCRRNGTEYYFEG
jgi:hypothetical protein